MGKQRFETPIITLDAEAPEVEPTRQAAKALAEGKVLILPTDTVYGVAVLASEKTQPETLNSLKGRPKEKGIALLIRGIDALEHYSKELPEYARLMAAYHWPGALTLVVRASKRVPPKFISVDGSVALRMPAHRITLNLLGVLDAPLACSSANLSGRNPAFSIEELDPVLAQRVDLIIDGGRVSYGKASTVVSCLGTEPVVLRQGPLAI